MMRIKGKAGTGDIVHAVKHLRRVVKDIRSLTVLSAQELYGTARELCAAYDLVHLVAETGELPVPSFPQVGL